MCVGGVCVSESRMLRPRADACGLFALGMDASQNTDIHSEMSNLIHVSHGTRDKSCRRAEECDWTEKLTTKIQEVKTDKETTFL